MRGTRQVKEYPIHERGFGAKCKDSEVGSMRALVSHAHLVRHMQGDTVQAEDTSVRGQITTGGLSSEKGKEISNVARGITLDAELPKFCEKEQAIFFKIPHDS